MSRFHIRHITPEDRPWIIEVLTEWWAGPEISTRGKVHYADRLPGFIAEVKKKPRGLVTYTIENGECEIVSFNSLDENIGIGTTLLEAMVKVAKDAGCRRLWIVTSNDNLNAMRFYQKRGLRLAAVHKDAIDASRKLKPAIPLTGNYGIPLKDEIEMEMVL